VDPSASVYRKASLVARQLRKERVLLILDGCEPLQEKDGTFRDKALQALLQELAAGHKGLAVCTTREHMDLPEAELLDLNNLTPEAGAQYLAKLGVLGETDQLIQASNEYGNHALALTLLGTYLRDFCDGQVMRRFEIKDLPSEDGKLYAHARKMIAAYESQFRGRNEEGVLRALGYFDRPAEPDALRLVLPTMSDKDYKKALIQLHRARLVLTEDPAQDLDCHPLIREHFSKAATEEGHGKLYEHYKAKPAKYQPDTLEEMTPLFYAVYHGCRAGRYQEACDAVYYHRILRGPAAYLLHNLGAFGTDLSLLANFFEEPWTQPSRKLSEPARSWLVGNAGFALRAVGQLSNAAAPIRRGGELDREASDWKNAAISHSNLADLLVTLGSLEEAVSAARESVELADRSGDTGQRMINVTTLADALHQSGDLAEARNQFEQAERLQSKHQPEYPLLYSLPGYRLCDLLLSEGKTASALGRATRTLPWVRNLLSIGLDHLTLGRAHPAGSTESRYHLDQAVDYLRRSGTLDRLPLALLARATPEDLAEVHRLATRSGMRLHLTDYHLISARQALAANNPTQARDHYHQAAQLIQQTGYHRRDKELDDLLTQLAP
jgi:tetratricopeptide (TPR) repeat protein